MDNKELKDFLDQKYLQYNNRDFIDTDPIQIPREFEKKENIEISAFLAASIAWGQRKTIINNAYKLVRWMDMDPLDFLMNAEEKDYLPFKDFKHRTFNGDDCIFFLKSLANIYKNHGGLEKIFSHGDTLRDGLINARKIFFSIEHPSTSGRQFSNIEKKSAAKRLNMYLRWMVRKDALGVDFGIWDKISPSQLYLPLDVHTASVGRKLGLLTRKQNDWGAVEEITSHLRSLDANDPVKYDFALFGLGAFENF
jgi:uncharacterized protein (TIGR02757 family)